MSIEEIRRLPKGHPARIGWLMERSRLCDVELGCLWRAAAWTLAFVLAAPVIFVVLVGLLGGPTR